MQRLVGFTVFLCFCKGNFAATNCFPDYCQYMTDVTSSSQASCLLTKVEFENCSKFGFDDAILEPPENVKAKFILRAYVYELRGSKVTAFNFTVTDVDFMGLVTRYQNLKDPTESACRQIEVYGNESRPAPTKLYVSCPFKERVYETLPYRLEYVVTGKDYRYRREYVFFVPKLDYIDANVNIKEYTPFAYIDKSHEPRFSLHVQPLPDLYNVTQYKIWLIDNDTDSAIDTRVLSVSDNSEVVYDFLFDSGAFYFKVSAVHSDCGIEGCANITTPCIVIRVKTSNRLWVAIVSTVWIPPVAVYVCYRLYKWHEKVAWKRRKKPKCLLVYSPTCLSHITVMTKLAKYLKLYRVDATIDILDFKGSTEEDRRQWCDDVFQKADVVLIAVSPLLKTSTVSTVYQNTSNHFLKLIQEQAPKKGKRYYVVHLSYCKVEDPPDGTSHFERFQLPKELHRLIRVIHRMRRIKYLPSVSDKEFADSVELAEFEIAEEDTGVSKDKQENENLLGRSSLVNDQLYGPVVLDDRVLPRSYGVNIDELDLLGERGDDERAYRPELSPDYTCAISINQLNL